MKFLKVLGGLMCFIGCLMALMGVLATAVPMIDNDQVQNIVSSFSAEGGGALTGGVNAVVRYCLENNYLVFAIGMALLLIGGLIKSRADKALFAMRFLGTPAEGDKAEARPEAQPEVRAEAPAAPRVTAWADLRPAIATAATAAPQIDMPPEAPRESPAAKAGFGRLFTAKRAKPAVEPVASATVEEAAEERAPAPAVFSPHEVLFPSADKTPAEVAKSVEEIVYGAPEKEAPVYSFATHAAPARREPEPGTVRAAAVAARERVEERTPQPEPAVEAPVYTAARAAYMPPAEYDMPVAVRAAAAPEPFEFKEIQPEAQPVEAEPAAVAQPVAVPVMESWHAEEPETIEPAITAPEAAEPVATPEPVAAPVMESWKAAQPAMIEPTTAEPVAAEFAAAPAPVIETPAAPVPTPAPVRPAVVKPEPVWEAPVYTASIFRPAPAPVPQPAPVAQPAPPVQPVPVPTFAPQVEAEPAAVPVARVTREPMPVAPKPAPTPMPKPVPAPAPKPAPPVQPVLVPTFAPLAEAEPAAVPVVRVTREPMPVAPKPAPAPMPKPAPAPVPQPVPAVQPISVPSFASQAETEPAAVPVARVTRVPMPAAPKPAPAPVPQQPVYTGTQSVATPIPNEAPQAQPAPRPAYAAAPSYAQPAPAAYRRPATAQVEWETKATANDRVIFATRQRPETRDETLTPPAPYRAPAVPPAPRPAQAAWTDAPEPVRAVPKYMRTPTMPGMPSVDRGPEPTAASARAPEPAPFRAPAPPPPPSRVKIVSTMRAYPGQEAAYVPQPGYYDYTAYAAPAPAYAEEPPRPAPAARPRIVSTMGKNRYPQP